jgi:hypothetical protein
MIANKNNNYVILLTFSFKNKATIKAFMRLKIMKNQNIPHLTEFIFAETEKIKKAIKILVTIAIITFGLMVWAYLNYDDYSSTLIGKRSRQIIKVGLAPTLYSWGMILGIFFSLFAFGVWKFTDFKNPTMGVNRQGIFMNRLYFKKTFIKWNEFESMEQKKATKNLFLKLKDPQSIIDQQPKGFGKKTLHQMLIKMERPFVELTNKELIEKCPNMIPFVLKNSGIEMVND